MIGKKGQIATEYMILTIFILIIVIVLFSYSYVNYEQNVRINQVNNMLDSLINKADYVYSLGPENSQFLEIVIPMGTAIEVVNLCDTTGNQYTCATGDEMGCACMGAEGGIRSSAIVMTTNLVGGPVKILRASRSPLQLVQDNQGNQFPCTAGSVFCDGKYRVRVCWNNSASSNICGNACSNDKICLKKV